MAQFDAKTVHKNDWGVIGGGAVVLVASFLTWFDVDTGTVLLDVARNGWNSGFLSWFGVLCAIVAAGLVAARVAGVDLPTLGVGWRTIILGLSALATVCIAFKLLVGFHSWDRGLGLFLAVIGALVQFFFAYQAFAESGERADIDRMRSERTANRPAPAAPVAGSESVPPAYTAPPVAPPVGYAPPPPPAAAATHDHDHDDHEGHDHPHP